jgi:hypothetical protein
MEGNMDLVSLAFGYILGVTSGYAIKFGLDLRTQKNVNGSRAIAKGNSVAQSGNIAGGHIAAGDVNSSEK